MDSRELLKRLDLIATSLESKGLSKFAMDIDIISNTIVANQLDVKLHNNPLLRGMPVEDPKKAIGKIRAMSEEDMKQALEAIMDPKKSQELIHGERTAANNILMDNIRAIGTTLKTLNVHLIALSPVLNEIGMSAVSILDSIINEGLSSPKTIFQVVLGINKLVNTLIDSLRDDGKIDLREAEVIAPILMGVLGKFGLHVSKDKVISVLQKVDFTSKMLTSLENLPQIG